ncbi:MAG: 3-oxoacyl-ACP synthase, partial [Bacillota bacterium]
MLKGRPVGITGIGISLPDRIMKNVELEQMVDTNDEWIRSRTGIQERRIADPGTSTSDLAAEAARNAMADAGVEPQDIDLIIVATVTPDAYFPATACIVQDKIGAAKAAAFDLEAGCSGFVYALAVGSQFIKTGVYNTV